MVGTGRRVLDRRLEDMLPGTTPLCPENMAELANGRLLEQPPEPVTPARRSPMVGEGQVRRLT